MIITNGLNLKGSILEGVKLKLNLPVTINDQLGTATSGGVTKLVYWDTAAGASKLVISEQDVTSTIGAITASKIPTVGGIKGYVDSELNSVNSVISTVTDIAENAANDIVTETGARIAADSNLQTQINNMSSMLSGGINIREDITLDLSGGAASLLSQLQAANATTAITKGQAFVIGVGGNTGLGGTHETLDANDMLIARINAPNLTTINSAEWHVTEHNIEDATTTLKGVVRFSTNAEVTTPTGTGSVVTPLDAKTIADDSFATNFAAVTGIAKKDKQTLDFNAVTAPASRNLTYGNGISETHPILQFYGQSTGEEYKFRITSRTAAGCTLETDVDINENIIATIIG